MNKHIYRAIAAIAIAIIAATAPPNIRLHVAFESSRPAPMPPSPSR